ncbi:MAG: zinc ribbon domain-containing protein [Candidatus Deferrimicrobiaceae bacterium]
MICPGSGHSLVSSCPSCRKMVSPHGKFCPYCRHNFLEEVRNRAFA